MTGSDFPYFLWEWNQIEIKKFSEIKPPLQIFPYFHIKKQSSNYCFFHFFHFRIKIWSKYLSFSSFCSTYFSYSVQLAPLLVQPSLQPCKNKKWSYESSILQWSYNPNRDVGTDYQMGDSGDMSPPKFGQKVKHNKTKFSLTTQVTLELIYVKCY